MEKQKQKRPQKRPTAKGADSQTAADQSASSADANEAPLVCPVKAAITPRSEQDKQPAEKADIGAPKFEGLSLLLGEEDAPASSPSPAAAAKIEEQAGIHGKWQVPSLPADAPKQKPAEPDQCEQERQHERSESPRIEQRADKNKKEKKNAAPAKAVELEVGADAQVVEKSDQAELTRLKKLTKRIGGHRNKIEQLLAEASADADRAGEILCNLKEKYGKHGQWLPWLAQNAPWLNVRNAQRWMKRHLKKRQMSYLKEAQLLLSEGERPAKEAPKRKDGDQKTAGNKPAADEPQTEAPAPRYRCPNCDHELEDDSEFVTLYECGECGTIFSQEKSANYNHQCLDCNRFGRLFAERGCPECLEAEMEKIEEEGEAQAGPEDQSAKEPEAKEQPSGAPATGAEQQAQQKPQSTEEDDQSATAQEPDARAAQGEAPDDETGQQDCLDRIARTRSYLAAEWKSCGGNDQKRALLGEVVVIANTWNDELKQAEATATP